MKEKKYNGNISWNVNLIVQRFHKCPDLFVKICWDHEFIFYAKINLCSSLKEVQSLLHVRTAFRQKCNHAPPIHHLFFLASLPLYFFENLIVNNLWDNSLDNIYGMFPSGNNVAIGKFITNSSTCSGLLSLSPKLAEISCCDHLIRKTLGLQLFCFTALSRRFSIALPPSLSHQLWTTFCQFLHEMKIKSGLSSCSKQKVIVKGMVRLILSYTFIHQLLGALISILHHDW